MNDVKCFFVCLALFFIYFLHSSPLCEERNEKWKKKKLGIVRTSAGVKQIEVMNINSQKQKPIPFLFLLFLLLGGFYFRVERDSSTAQREALAVEK